MGGAAQPPPAQFHPVGSTQHQNRQLSCCIHSALLFKQMYKMWLDARMGGGQTEPKVSCKQRGSNCTPKQRVKYRVKRQSNGERRAEPTSPRTNPYQSGPNFARGSIQSRVHRGRGICTVYTDTNYFAAFVGYVGQWTYILDASFWLGYI